MIELFVFALIVAFGLVFLIALPLILLGVVLRVGFAILFLPFRLLGALFGATAGLVGGLFKGLFGLVFAVLGLVALVVALAVFPLGILLLLALCAIGLVKFLAGAFLGAAA